MDRKATARAEVELVVMTRDQLISALREAFPGLANPQQEQNEILTEEQVAEMLNVTPRTVRNYAHTLGLPAKDFGKGRGKRFIRSQVLAWLDARASKPGAHVDQHLTRLKRARG